LIFSSIPCQIMIYDPHQHEFVPGGPP
jgi:hypothetical protein